MVQKMSTQEFEQMNQEGLVLIDFSAAWCGPCQMIAPVLEQVSEEYEGKVIFCNIDVDENPDLAGKYEVQSIPALVLLKDGKNVEMQIGFQPKDSIKEFLDKYL